jgi:hypothetical protein
VQNHTKLGAQVRRTMAEGRLVDGFPQNVSQAEFFLGSYDIDAVIHLDMPDREVRRRVLSRPPPRTSHRPFRQLLGRKSALVTVDARADRETVARDICAGQRLLAESYQVRTGASPRHTAPFRAHHSQMREAAFPCVAVLTGARLAR